MNDTIILDFIKRHPELMLELAIIDGCLSIGFTNPVTRKKSFKVISGFELKEIPQDVVLENALKSMWKELY